MSILERFCDALKQAIIDYETEMQGKIPPKRQPTLIELYTLLEDAQQEECQQMVWLKPNKNIPTLEEIEKFTIYLTENNGAIHAYWYAQGQIETAITQNTNKCEQIKNVLDHSAIEKSDDPSNFDTISALCGYKNRQLDSVGLREKMIHYLKNMPANRLAFIPFFESRLRIKLQAVLDNPDFSESRLSSTERMEIRTRQKYHNSKIESLKSQISALKAELQKEQAKDNVETVNALTQELAKEKKNTIFLTTENNQLRQSVDDLFTECNTLKTANETLTQEKNTLQTYCDDLEAKYQALLKEKQSPSQSNPHTKKGFFT